jgi:transposase-like protein
LIPKGQTRFEGFDDKISSLHARRMTVREIQGHLIEIHGIDVSPDLISRVTDSVLDEVHEWQGRPLDPVHPIVFFDASRVKIRAEGLVKNKAVHVALAYRACLPRLLTMPMASQWRERGARPLDQADRGRQVPPPGQARGTRSEASTDIPIAAVDGLKGFPEAIPTVFPDPCPNLHRASDQE